MSYVPPGAPEGTFKDMWVSGRCGDARARCLASSLNQKGHDVTLVDVKKSAENPVKAWGEVVIEQPRKSGRQGVGDTVKRTFRGRRLVSRGARLVELVGRGREHSERPWLVTGGGCCIDSAIY
eukprot:TRINITY_DN6913_c0_g1_i1.p1 TRINITY_DN6913_c0_g1~~TRINITY_DN6913_c0_g1_i1.p1  ORF type:complete len:123 (+),score=2.76 TRINITY_DN6913_c0_g1_i1:88-456(+)